MWEIIGDRFGRKRMEDVTDPQAVLKLWIVDDLCVSHNFHSDSNFMKILVVNLQLISSNYIIL